MNGPARVGGEVMACPLCGKAVWHDRVLYFTLSNKGRCAYRTREHQVILGGVREGGWVPSRPCPGGILAGHAPEPDRLP